MLSPAQISKQKALAARLGRSVPRVLGIDRGASGGDRAALVPVGRAASEQDLLVARLGVDLRRLSEIQSLDNKLAAKREMLPAYLPWIQGLLIAEAETGAGVQDEILVQMMIWHIDIGDFDGALPLIGYVLKHRLALPERFKRTAATLIAEESADAALKALGQGGTFDLGYLLKIDAITGELDMIDQVRAKLMKAIGLIYAGIAAASSADADGAAGAQRAAIETGLRYLKRALELDEKSGVKTHIRDLERTEKKLAEPAGT
jgi:hypothetical protein